MRTPRRHRSSGFTLLEMMFACVLLVVIAGAVALTSKSTTSAYKTGSAVSALDDRARRAMDRIVAALQAANRDSTSPRLEAPFSAEEIQYLPWESFDGVAVVFGDTARIALEYAPGETDDDLDENGDGIADDCVIVLYEDDGLPTQRRFVLTSGVSDLLQGETFDGTDENGNGLLDERGLSFVHEGQKIIVRLTLEGRDERGVRLLRSAERTVVLRNRDV